ncbi:MAG: outer membrane beta-barrel protein, partial [Mariniphaga sp.]
NKWFAGFVFSPDYAYRSLYGTDLLGEEIVAIRNNQESPKFGITTGFSILYQVSTNFELESGLFFSDKGFRYASDDFYAFESDDPFIPKKATVIYRYRYLDVPLKVNWFFLNKKTRLFLSAGLTSHLFLEASFKNIHEFDGRTEKETFTDDNTIYSKVNLGFSGGIGMEYSISKRFYFRIQPEFRRILTSMAQTPIKMYCWSVGVNTGICFGL